MSDTQQDGRSGAALVRHSTIEAIVSQRDAALRMATEAAGLHAEAVALAGKAQAAMVAATGGHRFTAVDRDRHATYQRLFAGIDPEASVRSFREQLDACTWLHVFALAGINDLMDRTARDAFYRDLERDVPPVTVDNVAATIERLAGDAELIFQRGLARVFGEFDRRFKSHDGFKVGWRVVLTGVFDGFGHWSHGGRAREILADVTRVLARFDSRRNPDIDAPARAIEAARGQGLSPRRGMVETPYFTIKTFKNGNAHLHFTRSDLMDDVNRTLAAYYGEVFPDAAPDPRTKTPDDLRTKTGALSRDLAFYPTPDKAAAIVVSRAELGDTDEEGGILEPSAGDGALVRALIRAGVPRGRITAVEVAPERFDALARLGTRARLANFLTLTPEPVFAAVVMNPPFCGTHWMAHVMHAFDFLRPGGKLTTVLPATAEFGDSRAHETFRAWAREHFNGWSGARMFNDMPDESFAESGTRIATVTLTLRKAW